MAERLEDWLRRHPEMETRLTTGGDRAFATTDDPVWFAEGGSRLLGMPLKARRIRLSGVPGE
jgi:glutamate racemase